MVPRLATSLATSLIAAAVLVRGKTPRAAFCLTGQMRKAASDPAYHLIEPFQRVILTPFHDAGYSVDVFVVGDAEECALLQAALESLRPVAILCSRDGRPTAAEQRWLDSGPRIQSSSRESVLNQLRRVRQCANLLDPATYSIVAKQRLDAAWIRFPAEVAQLAEPGIIWLPWTSDRRDYYMDDKFAIGRPAEMWPFFKAYDELLDPAQWQRHSRFEALNRGITLERLWTTTLMSHGVQARHHPGICFNLLNFKYGHQRDICRMRPAKSHVNGFILDDALATPRVPAPGLYGDDPWQTARLLHLWFIEWRFLPGRC